MLEKKIGDFLTLREIRDGLIGGQLQELEAQKKKWNSETRFKAI